ncbi:MAG: hypothetical protein JW915_05350 [Chitinispirillaceae bacterium]|nr:hypothetical protein [Chitinispirillaceae bacterium]
MAIIAGAHGNYRRGTWQLSQGHVAIIAGARGNYRRGTWQRAPTDNYPIHVKNNSPPNKNCYANKASFDATPVTLRRIKTFLLMTGFFFKVY